MNYIQEAIEILAYNAMRDIGDSHIEWAYTWFFRDDELLKKPYVVKGVEGMVDWKVSKAIKEARKQNANGVVVYHNHPNGIAWPSDEDIIEAKSARKKFAKEGIAFHDCLLITETEWIGGLHDTLYYGGKI